MTIDDIEIDQLIAKARAMSDIDQAIAELERCRSTLVAENPGHPALDRVLTALDYVAGRQMDFGVRRRVLEERAEWLEATAGATALETLDAWKFLAEEADHDFDWPMVTRAWQHIVRAVPDDASPKLLAYLSDALDGLATRLGSDGDRARARAFAERNVMLRRRIGPPVELARSLEGLAYQCAEEGEIERAVDLYRQRLAILTREFSADDYRVKQAAAKIAELEAKRSGH